jgi:hypothetical protein|uniref:Uncharacterized protein n=1 Tax=candidate division WOR-3 bacterium TaxID=2052148 RepID=A0A7V3PS71_UNCW3
MMTFGDFYQKRVLTFPERVMRRLPAVAEPEGVRIEKQLFGWCLVVKNKQIECRSEVEAQFLKLCLELGLSEVAVPVDDRYLIKILPEFERLKAKVDEIMSRYLTTVESRKVRTQIRQRVYARLLKKTAQPKARRCQ